MLITQLISIAQFHNIVFRQLTMWNVTRGLAEAMANIQSDGSHVNTSMGSAKLLLHHLVHNILLEFSPQLNKVLMFLFLRPVAEYLCGYLGRHLWSLQTFYTNLSRLIDYTQKSGTLRHMNVALLR